jgi:hypothetical protein
MTLKYLAKCCWWRYAGMETFDRPAWGQQSSQSLQSAPASRARGIETRGRACQPLVERISISQVTPPCICELSTNRLLVGGCMRANDPDATILYGQVAPRRWDRGCETQVSDGWLAVADVSEVICLCCAETAGKGEIELYTYMIPPPRCLL